MHRKLYTYTKTSKLDIYIVKTVDFILISNGNRKIYIQKNYLK